MNFFGFIQRSLCRRHLQLVLISRVHRFIPGHHIHTVFVISFALNHCKADLAVACQTVIKHIGAKPNLYCEAIELVCGGSPIGCGQVERKAQLRGK